MIYITVRQSPVYRQMTLEEYLFQNYQGTTVVNNNVSNTKTYEFERASEHFTRHLDVTQLVLKLEQFNQDRKSVV